MFRSIEMLTNTNKNSKSGVHSKRIIHMRGIEEYAYEGEVVCHVNYRDKKYFIIDKGMNATPKEKMVYLKYHMCLNKKGYEEIKETLRK